MDVSGNVEEKRTEEIKIDKTAPALAVSCPAPVLLNGSASATIAIAKVQNGVDGVYEGAVSTAAATSGNAFRLAGDGQHIFNLSTKGMAPGTYRAEITLGDGTEPTVTFGLK